MKAIHEQPPREPGRNNGRPSKRPAPKRKKLQPLTGIARELFTHVLNSIAFRHYDDCCSVDDLAEKFGKIPGRLQPAIRKLAQQGYVAVEGKLYPMIYPTVAALRHQDPHLSIAEAEAVLRKAKRRR